jgi:hypothetical protein
MKALWKNLRPQWVLAISLFLGGAAGATRWSWRHYTRAVNASHDLELRQREWTAMRRAVPAPVTEVEVALQQQVEQAEACVRALRDDLGATGQDPIRATPPPRQRADAFFALAQFEEGQRALAQGAGVVLPDGTHFGFSAYANSGPPTALIGVVHRQQLVMQRLLEALWVARPVRLTRVQREAAESVGSSGEMARRSIRHQDYFDPATERTLHRERMVDTLTFRIGFVGKTPTLRRFLNRLAATDVALVVRGIEVEPWSETGTVAAGVRTLADLFRDEEVGDAGEDSTAAAVPIIKANAAEFLVTVEYLDFAVDRSSGALRHGEESS